MATDRVHLLKTCLKKIQMDNKCIEPKSQMATILASNGFVDNLRRVQSQKINELIVDYEVFEKLRELDEICQDKKELKEEVWRPLGDGFADIQAHYMEENKMELTMLERKRYEMRKENKQLKTQVRNNIQRLRNNSKKLLND